LTAFGSLLGNFSRSHNSCHAWRLLRELLS
ncbi:MAG: hypothetical protein ACI89J_002862, partial [Hyphomicrobiaceae bacterium]